MTDVPDISALSFEDALKELERIVGRLESGDAQLQEAIDLYERGDALRKISQNGILALIYAHLFSLQLMREIFAIQVSQGKVPQVTELPTG